MTGTAPADDPALDDEPAGSRFAPLVDVACVRRDGDGARPGHDILADEVPVALVFNGISHAVMMATPQDLEDFALGFSLTERIIERPGDLRDCRRTDFDKGIELALTIPARRFALLKERRRSLVGRTGCGLCGVESLDEAVRPAAALPDGPAIAAAVVARALAAMAPRQVLNQDSHAVHAAAWAGLDGEIALIREDVGRHNAVDKLIGALARAGSDPAAGFLVATSRCSYEIVQKAASAGIRVIAAVSAPTAYAVRLADGANMTLIAFARGARHSLYSHPERITG
ncbi:formate dehydrogenase accessory sulfurtransferase FdhD [Oleomonas cavernae]|uniref:Sulfur carrier protein FdhD n=1 Tax=Oleomonas cavernae TaxID=2320859 RepID=A0A418WC40_9PROT|nr:formate dehydrogenase accessory sulfurtransferase FdhD [Oleomonas cavernae]RJF87585.1 formate dehydrogenase accessory sulfurtransferase FdhD [Oleomonas cavernae]